MAQPMSTSPAPGKRPTSRISAVRRHCRRGGLRGITVTLVLVLAMGASPSADPVSAGTSLLPSSSSADDEPSEVSGAQVPHLGALEASGSGGLRGGRMASRPHGTRRPLRHHAKVWTRSRPGRSWPPTLPPSVNTRRRCAPPSGGPCRMSSSASGRAGSSSATTCPSAGVLRVHRPERSTSTWASNTVSRWPIPSMLEGAHLKLKKVR